MTKDEAIQELRNGKTLTHRFFSDDEAIRQPRAEIGEYEFEDGVKTSATIFWHFRQQDYWNNGWEEKK